MVKKVTLSRQKQKPPKSLDSIEKKKGVNKNKNNSKSSTLSKTSTKKSGSTPSKNKRKLSIETKEDSGSSSEETNPFYDDDDISSSDDSSSLSAGAVTDEFASMKTKIELQSKKAKQTKSLAKTKQHELPDEMKPGVVYIGHIPYGFDERAMKKFFSQFGEVLRLRISRHSKTGHSRGYAFVEFKRLHVARVVADALDKYLMYGRRLVVNVLEKEQQHPKMWIGAGKVPKRAPLYLRKARHAKAHGNAQFADDDQKRQRAVQRASSRAARTSKKRNAALAALGLPTLDDDNDNNTTTTTTTTPRRTSARKQSTGNSETPTKKRKLVNTSTSSASKKKTKSPAKSNNNNNSNKGKKSPRSAKKNNNKK